MFKVKIKGAYNDFKVKDGVYTVYNIIPMPTERGICVYLYVATEGKFSVVSDYFCSPIEESSNKCNGHCSVDKKWNWRE